ncbi:MAG: GTPase Era [Actinobacteria bacterium HGW-Actinobacteria-1]|jgi:GTP-binding protein Era|nr:MAG: GTPase Era [Actinobacteria bacterium HGW-Actinobacteria-1]
MTAPAYEVVKSGFVALVGRPNAGKSTLVNALVGSKVAITSNTPQTTRHRLRAIVDQEDAQIVFVDTPGLHKPEDALGEELNKSSMMALADVDVACLVIDVSAQIGPGDRWVAHRVAEAKAARVLILTKADIARPEEVEKQLAVASGLGKFDEVVICSAREGFNLDGVIAAVKAHLPDGPRYFPRDMPTDQPVEVMLAEFIRERILHNTRDEVPHAVGVAIDDMTYNKKSDTTTIMAVIYVERESQKGIIVGKGGEMIRKIGTDARVDLERLLGTKVYLDLRVKLKKDWRRDASQIKRFGYGEGR